MGLGGLTRDSIVGLNNLVKDDEEDQPRHTRRLSSSLNKGSDDKDQFLFLLDEPPTADAQPAADESTFETETSLNDGLASMTITPPKAPVTPVTAAPPTPYRVSATNSRSLDSYRTDKKSDSSSNSQIAYQGFNYEGYTDYYAEAYNYDYPDYGGSSDSDDNDNILCCLFPWLAKKKSNGTGANDDDDGDDESRNKELTSASSDDVSKTVDASVPTPSNYEDSGISSQEGVQRSPEGTYASVASNVSDSQGTPHEKPAIRNEVQSAASTASSTSVDSPMPDSKIVCPDSKAVGRVEPTETEEGYPVKEEGSPVKEEGSPVKKGILKKRTISVIPAKMKTSSKQADDPSLKRQLFPSYGPNVESKEKKSINFNPMARVLTIASRKDFPLSQKCQVWWQKHDYDEFKKTGRIISKAMECGGSEIWLASSNAWGKSQNRQIANNDKKKSSGLNDSEEYNKALSKYVGEDKKDNDESGDGFGNKWWCKFGHSRRGLEHIASPEEGKARQQSVLLSIRMTLEEQRRQRATRTKDPNKLRNVSMQYTSWARDLSLAAGAADAEAVSSNFNQAAKCRAHHFAKQMRFNTDSYADVGGGVAMAITSQILDANTHDGKLARTAAIGGKSLKDVNSDHEGSEASLSKRAKGFMPGANSEISAAAVLSGMGN